MYISAHTYIYRFIYTRTHTYIQNWILLSHKKEWNAISSYMDWPRDHTKQSQKDKYHIMSLKWGSNIWYKWTYPWNRNRIMDREQNGGCQGEGEWRAGIGRYKLVYIKWVNKDLLSHTGTRFSIQGHTIMGKNIYTCSTSQHLSRSVSVATEAHLPGPCLSTTIHQPGSLSS